MKIVSLTENKNFEKRVAITPEIAKKYITIGFEVNLPKDYALHLGFDDNEYKSQGVNIIEREGDIIEEADVIVQLALPEDDKLSKLKEGQNLIGVLNPFVNDQKLKDLSKKR